MELPAKIKELLDQVPWLVDYLWLLAAAAAAAVCIVALAAWIRFRKAKKAGEPPLEDLIDIEELVDEEEPEEPTVIDEDQIAQFFLKLYKVQLGASQDTSSEINPLEAESTADRKTFELRVLHNKQWVDRRMSVGKLGSEAASRSRCFYVIFDHHLVVKVPRKPIRRFEDYCKAIEDDQKIVKQLAPRECIVPSVSAVLKLIHPIAAESDATRYEVESKYIQLLRKYPGLNEHLKIGNTYLLVMDLSKFYFLSQVIEDVHDLNNKMKQEIVGYPDVVWENHGFEGRYAFENDEQVEAIRNVYTVFEERLGKRLKAAGHNRTIARYTMQKWFLEHLSGGRLQPDEKDVTSELVAEINALAGKVFDECKEPIEIYRRTIRGCIQAITVSQNKHQLGTLITNILDLLAWLRHKQIAIRDLKPDNLIVAGDRSRYPEFLNSANDYSVGLIDVETAVSHRSSDNRKIRQPILGGTPSFATPAHLVKNKTLQKLYHSLPRHLYLQDWYAAVGIIYEVITGEVLFRQSGKMIVGMKTALFSNVDDIDTQTEFYRKASCIFWHSAVSELRRKLKVKKDILSMVQVAIPDGAREMLRQEFANEKLLLDRGMRRYVAGQTAFKGERLCNSLICASREKITQLKSKWEDRPQDQTETLKVLRDLEKMKIKAEKQMPRIKLLEPPALILSADRLLRILFDIVLDAMHRSEWGDLTAAEITGIKKDTEATTIESTV